MDRAALEELTRRVADGKAALADLRLALEVGESLTRAESLALLGAAELLLVAASELLRDRARLTAPRGDA